MEAVSAVKRLLRALNRGQLPHRAAAASSTAIRAPGTPSAVSITPAIRPGAGPRGALPYLPAELRKLSAMELGELVADYRVTQRSVPPQADEPEVDDDDFERRVLRWIR